MVLLKNVESASAALKSLVTWPIIFGEVHFIKSLKAIVYQCLLSILSEGRERIQNK